MVYRVVIGVLLVLALLLTANEKYLESRARGAVESDAFGVGSASAGPIQRAMESGAPELVRSGRTSIARTGPFVPHRVRMRRDVSLLRDPETGAPPAEPVSFVPAGISAQAIAESGDWYLLDTSLTRGWAPREAIEEP